MMLSKSNVSRYDARMSISNDLRRIIESSELSRYEIAQRSGVMQGTLSKLMAGADVTTRTLDALAPVLKLKLLALDSAMSKNSATRRMKRRI